MFLPSFCGDSYGAFSQQSNESRIGPGLGLHPIYAWGFPLIVVLPLVNDTQFVNEGFKWIWGILGFILFTQSEQESSIIRQSVSINGVIRGWVPFRNLRTPPPRIPCFSCVVQAPCGSCGRPQPWSFSGSRAFVVTCTLAAKSRGPWSSNQSTKAWSCSFGAIGVVIIMHILIHTNTC